MSLATALQSLDTQRDNLAANLTAKGVTSSNTETLAQLVPKVLTISGGGGTDTSDATATAADIKTGKTAYAQGTKLTGTHVESTSNGFSSFSSAIGFSVITYSKSTIPIPV